MNKVRVCCKKITSYTINMLQKTISIDPEIS